MVSNTPHTTQHTHPSIGEHNSLNSQCRNPRSPERSCTCMYEEHQASWGISIQEVACMTGIPLAKAAVENKGPVQSPALCPLLSSSP